MDYGNGIIWYVKVVSEMTSQDNYMYQYVYMDVYMGSAAAVSAVQKQGAACKQIQFHF